MADIHFFNPETEIVLALDKDSYTPNPRVVRFRKRLALLPALYGNKGDIILTEGIDADEISSLPFFDIALAKEIRIVDLASLDREVTAHPKNFHFSPWGWNKEMMRKMEQRFPGIPLPSRKGIENIRNLAHRRLTTEFFHFCDDGLFMPIATPEVLYSEEQLRLFLNVHEDFCFKAPWSSSGRGVVLSSEISRAKAFDWAKACIRKQGAVMGENLYNVRHNFASEWDIHGGKVEFTGFSFFKTSETGKYIGNLLLSQEKIANMIEEFSEIPLEEVIARQQEFISRHIFGNYEGPLGFDMFVTSDNILNPCVEINLRHTMGHVAIEIERQINSTDNKPLAGMYGRLFAKGIFSPLDFV